MPPHPDRLRMYGATVEHAPLDWSWVDDQLATAATYWLVAGGDRRPHPRPVWGAWMQDRLHLSIGSPALQRLAAPGAPVAVHLDSGVDVVIVEGVVTGECRTEEVLAAYDAKYQWAYDVDELGPLTTIAPSSVLAWRAAGRAGRDGFRQSGRWSFGR
jgi:hypothetical protein